MIVVVDQTLSLAAEQILDTLVSGVCWTVVGDLRIVHCHFIEMELDDFLNNFGVIFQLEFQSRNSRYSAYFIISFPVYVFLNKFCR